MCRGSPVFLFVCPLQSGFFHATSLAFYISLTWMILRNSSTIKNLKNKSWLLRDGFYTWREWKSWQNLSSHYIIFSERLGYHIFWRALQYRFKKILHEACQDFHLPSSFPHWFQTHDDKATYSCEEKDGNIMVWVYQGRFKKIRYRLFSSSLSPWIYLKVRCLATGETSLDMLPFFWMTSPRKFTRIPVAFQTRLPWFFHLSL